MDWWTGLVDWTGGLDWWTDTKNHFYASNEIHMLIGLHDAPQNQGGSDKVRIARDVIYIFKIPNDHVRQLLL